MIQTQYRQHAAHLGQLPRHGLQDGLVQRIAEKGVQQLFKLFEGYAQLADYAAHGLLIADPAVQLLHPALQRLGHPACTHAFEALSQAGSAHRQLRIAGIEVFKYRFEVQHGRGHFHGQLNAGHLAAAHRGVYRAGQYLRKRLARRVQLEQGIGHQAELIGHCLSLGGVARTQRRPGLLGRNNALARLGQQGWIKATELHQFVINRLEPGQAIGRAHRR